VERAAEYKELEWVKASEAVASDTQMSALTSAMGDLRYASFACYARVLTVILARRMCGWVAGAGWPTSTQRQH
jgi:hypothetical protein